MSWRVVVLNDGETFTAIEGCVILDVPDTVHDEEVDDWVKENAHKGFPIPDLSGFVDARRTYTDWDDNSTAIFTPWSDGYAVGFRCEVNGEVNYVRLNPSTSGSSPDVFVYADVSESEMENAVVYIGLPFGEGEEGDK